jgi:hypothetical protein
MHWGLNHMQDFSSTFDLLPRVTPPLARFVAIVNLLILFLNQDTTRRDTPFRLAAVLLTVDFCDRWNRSWNFYYLLQGAMYGST